MNKEQHHSVSPTESVEALVALMDESYQFRTPEGVSRESNIEVDVAKLALEELVEVGLARRPVVPDKGGRALYALATRRIYWQERYADLRSRVATW